MKILVCIKQVPEHTSAVAVHASGDRVEIPESTKYRINRFDEFAVEAAAQIKESVSGTIVDVVTVGPKSAETVIRRAMGMGADHGMIVDDGFTDNLTPDVISEILARVARRSDYDLVFTGIMSEDEMNAQTGQMLAAGLDIPSAVGVVEISRIGSDGDIQVIRERENGVRERLSISTPAVLTIQGGINRPRYPALSAILRANAKNIDIISDITPAMTDKGNDRSVLRIAPSAKIRRGKILEGSVLQKAEKLITILKERNVLI